MPVLWSTLFAIVPACVVYVWAVRAFPAAARGRRKLAVGLAIFALVQMASHRVVVHTHARVAAELHMLVATVGVTLAVTSLPLGVLCAVTWAIERAGARAPSPTERPSLASAPREAPAPGSAPATGADPARMTRRQTIEASAGVALFGAAGSMLGWGIARGRHDFVVDEIAVPIPGLPRALDGYVIAQISDIHAGVFVGEREIDEGFGLVGRTRPDLVVVTGDMVDHDARFAPLVAGKLAALRARDGVVACLGNHDYYAGAARVRAALESAGVAVLVDEGRVVRPADGGGFALLGVDDLAARSRGRPGPRIDRAVAAVPSGLARVLLSHQPPTVDRWAGRVALQLSGHTHGGQINPGGILNPLFEYVAGRYAVGGTTLYVSRGFGTVGPPARFDSPPEVTRIVLVAA